MKTAFENNANPSEVSNEMQLKLKQCLQQMRKGFTDLMKRRDDYKAAKLERKSKSKASLETHQRRTQGTHQTMQGSHRTGAIGIQTHHAIAEDT